MKGALGMAAAAIASALAVAAGAGDGLEIAFGMLAPLLAATVSWVAIERVWRRDPARLTSVMMTAFAAKVVFFGAYVAVMLKVINLRPVPFVASFTSYFIALYVTEAVLMRRLFAGG